MRHLNGSSELSLGFVQKSFTLRYTYFSNCRIYFNYIDTILLPYSYTIFQAYTIYQAPLKYPQKRNFGF